MAIDFIPASSPVLTYSDRSEYGDGSSHKWSWSFLVYSDEGWGDTANQNLLCCNDGSFAGSWGIFRNIFVPPDLVFILYGGADYATIYVVDTTGWATGAWIHLVLAYDGALGTDARAVLYKDGSPVTTDGNATYDADQVVRDASSALRVGSPATTGVNGTGTQADMKLCEVAMWQNVTLSSVQASNIYNSGSYKSPLFEPTGLSFYTRMTDTDTLDDEVNAVAPSAATNLANFTHPTVLYPSTGHPASRRLAGAGFARSAAGLYVPTHAHRR